MKRSKWLALFLAFSLLLSACQQPATQEHHPNHQQQQNKDSNDVTDLNWKVPEFQYVDQNGKPFGTQNLKGKVWIVDFIFTRCPNVCPPMTANMAKLQNELKKAGVQAELVSFSVDPKYDKPEVLTKFAQNYKADFSNWHFLTGYSEKWIQDLVKNTFKSVVQNVSENPNMPMFNHPSQFYLIDQKGQVRKVYDGLRPDYQKIVQDVKEVGAEK